MNNLKFDSNIYDRIKDCNTVNELAEVVLELTEELSVWQKVLTDTLSNIDSDNISEINFANIKCYNLDKIMDKYATISWVTENFTAKN